MSRMCCFSLFSGEISWCTINTSYQYEVVNDRTAVLPCLGMPKHTFSTIKWSTVVVKQYCVTQCVQVAVNTRWAHFQRSQYCVKVADAFIFAGKNSLLDSQDCLYCTVEDQHTTQEQCCTLVHYNEIQTCQANILSKSNWVLLAKTKMINDCIH